MRSKEAKTEEKDKEDASKTRENPKKPGFFIDIIDKEARVGDQLWSLVERIIMRRSGKAVADVELAED